jgi:hypothetical protein
MQTNCPQTGSLGLHKQSLPPQAGIKSAQADFVCIAAISNRQVFLQKWDAPVENCCRIASANGTVSEAIVGQF